VCRKLRLAPGETVLETGCRLGALALHMAKHYGATVKAYNISKEQIAYARDAHWRKAWTAGCSSSRTITATLPANSMRSYPSACSNTSHRPVPGLGGGHRTAASRMRAAGSSIPSARPSQPDDPLDRAQ